MKEADLKKLAQDYVIPPEHEEMLKRAFQLDVETDDLPEDAKISYWARKVIADRLSYELEAGDMVQIALERSAYVPPPQPPSFIEHLKKSKVSLDTPIEVRWRNKWHPAKFKGLNGRKDKVLAMIDNDDSAEVREIPDECVRFTSTPSLT